MVWRACKQTCWSLEQNSRRNDAKFCRERAPSMQRNESIGSRYFEQVKVESSPSSFQVNRTTQSYSFPQLRQSTSFVSTKQYEADVVKKHQKQSRAQSLQQSRFRRILFHASPSILKEI